MLKQITFLLLIASILSGCNPYSSKDAERDGHVVSGPAGQANVEKLERFYIRFQSKEQDKLRIVHYTDEGDPVYLDLKSTDQSIQFSRDTSEDKFGGQDKGKKTTVCNQIVKKIGQRGEVYGTEYDLKDCSDDIGYSDLQNKEYFLLFIEQKKNRLGISEKTVTSPNTIFTLRDIRPSVRQKIEVDFEEEFQQTTPLGFVNTRTLSERLANTIN